MPFTTRSLISLSIAPLAVGALAAADDDAKPAVVPPKQTVVVDGKPVELKPGQVVEIGKDGVVRPAATFPQEVVDLVAKNHAGAKILSAEPIKNNQGYHVAIEIDNEKQYLVLRRGEDGALAERKRAE